MKLLESLSALFNRSQTISIPRQTLAMIVEPFMRKGAEPTNEAIANGFEETAEWLRIGFDCETDKGSMYHALHHSLQRIASAVKSADADVGSFDIKKEYLELIKSTRAQLTEASRYLDQMSKQKANYKPQTVEDRHGNTIVLPFTQIYNRPNAAHDLMGMKLEDVESNFDRLFADVAVKPAANWQLDSFVPRRR